MRNLSETTRIATAGTLVVLGFIIIISGFVKIGNLFTEPFDFPFIEQPDEALDEQRKRDALITKDTDTDGLNDYDELFVYNTSPYLNDSDSDGIHDREEIEAGDDPNCPQGEDCYGAILELEEETSLGGIPSNENINSISQEDRQALLQALPEDLTPDEIRGILIEAGFEESLLNQLTDQEILETYQQTLNAFGN